MQPNASDRVESRLRAEAMVLRRPAPDGLMSAVMTRVAGAEPEAVRSRPRRARRPFATVGAVVGLAALAAALVLLRGEPPRPAAPPASEPRPFARAAVLLGATTASLERPLLAELEALGQDTARAAAALARELPGPVGKLFER